METARYGIASVITSPMMKIDDRDFEQGEAGRAARVSPTA